MSAFEPLTRPIWDALRRLEARMRVKPSLARATVTAVGPIRVQLDGKPASVAPSPSTLVPVGVGDRVMVAHHGGTQITILGVIGAGGRPWRQAAGAIVVTGDGTAVASAQVFYPAGRFTTAPIVTLGTHSIAHGGTASNRTTTGFTANVRRYDADIFSGGVPIHWNAVQMTPDSAEG